MGLKQTKEAKEAVAEVEKKIVESCCKSKKSAKCACTTCQCDPCSCPADCKDCDKKPDGDSKVPEATAESTKTEPAAATTEDTSSSPPPVPDTPVPDDSESPAQEPEKPAVQVTESTSEPDTPAAETPAVVSEEKPAEKKEAESQPEPAAAAAETPAPATESESPVVVPDIVPSDEAPNTETAVSSE